jgi:hypothetical protein
MNLMNKVFMEELDKFIVVFIDDILLYSRSTKEHGQYLRIVLGKPQDQQLYAKFSKCEFWLQKASFLGHILTAEGVAVDPEKVTVVANWKRPISVTEIRSFLGLASYYRRFIEEFSKIARPMRTLLQKDKKFEWTNACERSFCEFVYPLLAHFVDPSASSTSNVPVHSSLAQESSAASSPRSPSLQHP